MNPFVSRQIYIANHGVIIRPNVIGCVLNIVKYEDDADIVIVYKNFTRYEDLYKYPVSSHTLGIYLVSKLSNELKACYAKDILCKYLLFPYKNLMAAFQLIHTDNKQ